ncbi:MAG: L-serine ammonia-lyase, iron-sulfur-dependent, subunit alpha, partial [Clostridia bacterium]|nr:L-serine ammonia-lyase, iron-sulfur-dependent, subunit alpha [Clostridia bacterium]
VISATCGAISGLAYMLDEPLTVIENVIINTLARDVGVVCDGAKASCASKIACGFECALNAFFLAVDNKKYGANTGIICRSLDSTIKCVGAIATKGMCETDKKILEIMLENKDN